MLDVLMPFAHVSLELADLLGVRFIPNSRAQQGAVGRALGDVIRFQNERRYLERDLEIARLALLAQQLRVIQRNRPDVFPSLRRRLRAGSISDFHGARQEVTVASKLIRSGMPFDHELEGRPDFVIRGPAGESGIECTSVHLQRAKEGVLFYKVESCVRAKAKKTYAGPNVAVAIATTSIDSVAGIADEQRDALYRSVGETCLGSVLTFTVLVNRDGDVPRFESAYRRVDAPAITRRLRSTLDALFPIGNHSVRDYAIPRGP